MLDDTNIGRILVGLIRRSASQMFGPHLHHGAATFHSAITPIRLLGLVAHDMRQGMLGKFAGERSRYFDFGLDGTVPRCIFLHRHSDPFACWAVMRRAATTMSTEGPHL